MGVLEKFPGEKAYFEDLAESRRKQYLKGPRGEEHIESSHKRTTVVPSPRNGSREVSPRKASREPPLRPISKESRHLSKESTTDQRPPTTPRLPALSSAIRNGDNNRVDTLPFTMAK